MSETSDRIEGLRAEAKRWWDDGIRAHARHYDVLAQADQLDGDLITAEFHASLAACYREEPGAQERKDRAFAALMARPERAAETTL